MKEKPKKESNILPILFIAVILTLALNLYNYYQIDSLNKQIASISAERESLKTQVTDLSAQGKDMKRGLDDMTSELDAERNHNLLRFLEEKRMQVFITTTSLQNLDICRQEQYRTFLIDNGKMLDRGTHDGRTDQQ